jgi:glycosyltransferase
MLRCLLQPRLRVKYVPEVLVRMRTGGASNRSLRALLRKSSEDLRVMQHHGVGGWASLALKNLRKLPQFLAR